jgi:DNA-3-methyladenine glycosylase
MLDPTSFFSRDIDLIARDLLGATLALGPTAGIIVETEAYHPTDPASHSFRGPTPANRAMFMGPGRIYVYRSYGMHWCVNFTAAGNAAVLIRALEPVAGLDIMARRRGLADPRQLCSGPGKLTAALGIDKSLDTLPLAAAPLSLTLPKVPPDIVTGPRIGITKAVELPWRFGIRGSRFLSRPIPKTA